MRAARRTSKTEPTIALINIVFLMLIFFLVAGTLAQPLDRDLTLVETAQLDPTAPPDALILHADGRTTYRGAPVADAATFLTTQAVDRIRIVPDRNVEAARLVALSRDLRAAGASSVVIVTEQALR